MPTVTLSNAAELSALRNDILRHVTYSIGAAPGEVAPREMFRAVALTVRDRMVDTLLKTEQRYRQADAKRLYYVSMEFLIGRSLRNNLLNLDLVGDCSQVLEEYGMKLADLEQNEVDAALGNGGLGRLAACFLDSLATLGLPGFGYGINYEYGLFKQEIRGGEQIERPDNWRTYYTSWELERPQDAVLVPLYGRIEHGQDREGSYNPMWLDWKVVIGVPYDIPIAGYGGRTVNYLRLFSARASEEMDMSIFNDGDYLNAIEQKVHSETISKVLYPSDSVAVGRELRLIQEYFLVACSVRDIVRRYLRDHEGFEAFPAQVAIQLNDTHPALAIVELQRLLVDEFGITWDDAWSIVTRTFAYTNHTLMPEALEKWPLDLMEKVLPRHLQIIYEINRRFLGTVAHRWPGQTTRVERMSLIEEGTPKQVRMANLAIVGSHSVNGVAAVHSRLVKRELVPDFAEMWPAKFNNKTNGVTPRRWLLGANPGLAALLKETLGDGWITDLEELRQLEPHAANPDFQSRFMAGKRSNKQRLAEVVQHTTGWEIDCDSLFDIQVKRIHEYKRQLLNLLHVAHVYLRLADDGVAPAHPSSCQFAGKAAPGYHAAKQVIRLINDVAQVVNHDDRVRDCLQVAFIPDYRVSLAEIIIPAADLSEQVSTAGMEASGTGNMKFAMNGALTIGTPDGANIEICEEVGAENIFMFGKTVDEIGRLRADKSYHPREIYERSPIVRRILDAFREDRFCPRHPGSHAWVSQKLMADGEHYFHLADLESYLEAHEAASATYCQRASWAQKAILNVARSGKFSSDRTIQEYARDIWEIESFG